MRQKGFTPLIIIVLLGLLALGAGGYYFIKMSGLSIPGLTTQPGISQKAEMTEEVSDAADSDTLDREIDETQIDSYDSDFSELDSSASQL